MSKYAIVTVLLLCFFSNGYTQKTLSDYSYIVIPEQYDFLSEVDKYQTNSLTKFLFNKYGFHAYFEHELPENLVVCDGLKANVLKSSGIIYTKLQIVISDCHGKEVYRSPEGKSKIKEFSKVFNDALRKAFASIISLQVNQKEISFEEPSNTSEVNELTKEEVKVIAVTNNKEVKNTPVQEIKKEMSSKSYFPAKKYSAYKIVDKYYLLRKTEKGYRLYQDKIFNPYEGKKNNGLVLLGEILISKSKVFYLGLQEKLVDASFDESFNLIIEKPSGKLIYKYID